MCFKHSQKPEIIQAFLAENENFHRDLIANCKTENTKEEENVWFTPLANNEWRCGAVLDDYYGADRSLFKASFTQKELLACLPSSKKSIVRTRGKVAALRRPFLEEEITQGSVPQEALEWQQYMNNLCKVYEASFVTTPFDDNQWANVESINEFLLEKVGFHREGLKMTKPTSVRKHNEESTKAHNDHPAFCWDYLLGCVLRGSYRLAFILNPCEVMLGQKPKFDFVKLEKGDVYCMTGPRLRLPHLPIPAKGKRGIKREVLLIGGLFLYDASAIIGRRFYRRHEDLMESGLRGPFYHYRLKHLTTEEVISGLKENANFLYDNRMKLLDHVVPGIAIDGDDVIYVIDQLESLEVYSSTTLYLPCLVIYDWYDSLFTPYYYFTLKNPNCYLLLLLLL